MLDLHYKMSSKYETRLFDYKMTKLSMKQGAGLKVVGTKKLIFIWVQTLVALSIGETAQWCDFKTVVIS